MCFFRVEFVKPFRLYPSTEMGFGSNKTAVAVWPWVCACQLHLLSMRGWCAVVLSALFCSLMLSLPLLLLKTQVMSSMVLQRLHVCLRYVTQNWVVPKL